MILNCLEICWAKQEPAIAILVLAELLLGGGFDDDNDDQDGGMLIPAYSSTKS